MGGLCEGEATRIFRPIVSRKTFGKDEGKKRGVWMSYGREEKILMDYLAENETITLSRFGKIARTSKLQAEKILINLILMNVIAIEQTERTTYFRMRQINY